MRDPAGRRPRWAWTAALRGGARWLPAALAAALPAVAGEPPPVSLNHAFTVVDDATYAAIEGSSFVHQELAAAERRSTTSGDGDSWTGLYLYGRSTYFELLRPGAYGEVGRGGIGFGVDGAGDLERIRQRLAAHLGEDPAYGLRTRKRDGVEIPWFHALGLGFVSPRVMPWVMEYHGDFLKRWYPGLPPREAGVSRRSHRAREFAPGRYLQDVVGIHLALQDTDRDRLASALQALGYGRRREAEALVLDGPALRITVRPAAPERAGLLAVDLTLTRDPPAPRRLDLGRSVLALGPGRTATWTFQP